MKKSFLTAAVDAAAASRAYVRAARAACPALADAHPAAGGEYLDLLAVRPADAAAAALGGTVKQQRAVRKAHRKYNRACRALGLAFVEGAQP